MRNVLIFLIVPFLLFSSFQERGKAYFVRVTIDKIAIGSDSVVFRNNAKTIYLETNGRSDTFEVAQVKGKPVAMNVEVQKYFAGKQIRYRLGYAFFKKNGEKWELIKHFGFTDRFSLLPRPAATKPKGSKMIPATEEYACSIGEPMQFSARFRMDVYLN